MPGPGNACNNQLVKKKNPRRKLECTLGSMQSKQHNSKTITDFPVIVGCSTL